MEPRFTDEQVMTTLREVVNERPDFVYEPPVIESVGPDDYTVCRYVDMEGAPSCLVGHVMGRLGLPLDVLAEKEGVSPQLIPNTLGISLRAAYALTKAQDEQDQGEEWSVALEAAEREFERE